MTITEPGPRSVEAEPIATDIAAKNAAVGNEPDGGRPIAVGDNAELQLYKPWDTDRRYKPRLMSRWMSPTQLAAAGVKERIAGTFESFSDRRETLAQREAVILMHPSLPDCEAPGRRLLFESSWDREASDELWIDYVADVGDGFSSTYTVAAEIAMRDIAPKEKSYAVDPAAERSAGDWGDDASDRDRLQAAKLQRGELLVMGGDQVYPLATDTEYRNRTVGPYETACRHVAEEPMGLLAVPGNHDWYDGLTSFLSRFCSEGWIGGWQTRQTRSYWAAKVQDGWWMWGIDIGLEQTPIDHHQLEYFRTAAADLVDGDQIILVTSKPAWLQAEPSLAMGRRLREIITAPREPSPPKDYDQLAFFMSTTLANHEVSSTSGTRPRFAVILSGDKHYYCRYDRNPDAAESATGSADDAAIPHVVAGGGGAYLSLPYGLVDRVRLPTRWRARKDEDHVELIKAQQWPDAKATSRIGNKSIVRIVSRNWGFCAVLALIHLGLAAIAGFDDFTTSAVENFGQMFTDIGSNGWWALTLAAMVAAGTARLPLSWLPRLLVSLTMTILQLGALAVATAITVLAVDDGLGFAATTWAAITVGLTAVSWVGWGARMAYYFGRWPRMAIGGAIALAAATFAVFFALPESAAWILILFGVASVLAGAAFAFSMLVAVAIFGAHDNLISVAARESGYKNFLRLHIDRDSNLHVYAIGFEQVPHQRFRWRTANEGVNIAADTPEVTARRPLNQRLFGTRPERFEPRLIDAFSVKRRTDETPVVRNADGPVRRSC